MDFVWSVLYFVFCCLILSFIWKVVNFCFGLDLGFGSWGVGGLSIWEM